MSVQTVEAPMEERTDEHDLIHLFCCRPWRGLCGERLHGESLGYDYPDSPDDCLVCLDLEDGPCGVPGCSVLSRVRSWWRSRRSS